MKKSAGNMYPWVTHTHSFLAGECPHRCSYCYVRAMGERFPAMRAKYSGPLRLDERALIRLGSGRTIFVEHLNDLFADAVPDWMIRRVLAVCRMYPGNTYVFQTKNPRRYLELLSWLPQGSLLGTTLESDLDHEGVTEAPSPVSRFEAMSCLGGYRLFVTVEPILRFYLDRLLWWIERINPEFVNIGADSKNRGLPEPTRAEVLRLIAALQERGLEVRQKSNLERLL